MPRTYKDKTGRPQPTAEQIVEVIAERKQQLKEAPRGERKKFKHSIRATKERRERAAVELLLKDTSPAVVCSALELHKDDIARIRNKYQFIFDACDESHDLAVATRQHEQQRGKVLSAAEMRLVQSMMAEDKLERAQVHNLAYAMREVSTLRRLEAGQSTSNQAISFTRVTRKE